MQVVCLDITNYEVFLTSWEKTLRSSFVQEVAVLVFKIKVAAAAGLTKFLFPPPMIL